MYTVDNMDPNGKSIKGEDIMKRRAPVFIVILLLAVLAVPAFAAGPYVGAEAGAVFLSDTTFSSAGNPDINLKNDTGYGLGLVGGYDFGTYRVEGEFAWRKNDNKEATDDVGTFKVDGDYSTMALMANGYYDFRMVSPTFVPYVGAGIGYARVAAKGSEPTTGTFVDDSDMVFAYQFAAGVGYVIGKEITLDLGYKYFATAKPEFEFSAGAGGGKVEAEYSSHNIFLGLRYSF